MLLFRRASWTVSSLLVLAWLVAPGSAVASTGHDATPRSQNTSAMQQMDHQRRLSDEREARAERQKSELVTDAQESAASLDYALVAILASSGLVFFVICRSRDRSARQGLPRRGPRFQPPSRN